MEKEVKLTVVVLECFFDQLGLQLGRQELKEGGVLERLLGGVEELLEHVVDGAVVVALRDVFVFSHLVDLEDVVRHFLLLRLHYVFERERLLHHQHILLDFCKDKNPHELNDHEECHLLGISATDISVADGCDCRSNKTHACDVDVQKLVLAVLAESAIFKTFVFNFIS